MVSLAYCAALASAFVPAWLIWQYSVDVPYLDQWLTAHFFEKLAQGRLTLSDLHAQQNEYRQFFPHLIFTGLGWLTDWDVRYEMLVSLLLACLIAFNVQRLGAQTEPNDLRRSVLFLLACLFIFSAIQFDNWLFGVQVVYFMPVACVTTGLLLAYCKRAGTRAVLVACACLSVVSTFSSANGLLCWVVLPPVLYAVRPEMRVAVRRWLPVWALGAAICVAVYAYGYQSPASHPSPTAALRHPFYATVYFLSVLGGTFAVGRWPQAFALTAGAGALVAYVMTCAYLIKFRAASGLVRGAAGWLALGAYSLCTAAMITVGRLGFGVSQSLSTRYTTFTLYLMVALIYLLPYVLKDAANRGYLSATHRPLLRRLAAAAVLILLFAHVTIFALIVRHGASDWRRGMLKAKACLLFIETAPEERCLKERLHPNVRLLREQAESLDRIGYLRPPLVRAGRLRDLAASEGCSEQYGSFAILSAGSDYLATGRAWLPHRSESADAVVLAYVRSEGEQQTVFALAEVEANVGRGSSATPDDALWRKTFSAALVPDGSDVELTAWALDAERGKAYRLCGTPAPR